MDHTHLRKKKRQVDHQRRHMAISKPGLDSKSTDRIEKEHTP